MNLSQKFCLTDSSGEDIYLFTLKNTVGTEVSITNYGAIISSFFVKKTNVVLGFEDVSDYLSDDYLAAYPYLGCVIGRYANRIKDGKFELDGNSYSVTANTGKDHLHGGKVGFDRKTWQLESFSEKPNQKLVLSYLSKDGEEGFPGNLFVKISFELNDQNELLIQTDATTDKTTLINLTHHDYFNLNGNEQITDHLIRIHAKHYLGQDKSLVADGSLKTVSDSPFDFREFRTIKINDGKIFGYDQTFVIDKNEKGLVLAAECIGNNSGLKLEVFTTEPAVHFYTAEGLPVVERRGKKLFGSYAGLCFETQKHPNGINIPHFPDSILRPGEIFIEKTIYRISQS